TLVARDGMTLADLPEGARVGTSSIRRQAQLLAVRPDLCVESIRGNVPTRVRKVMDGQYDATLLAAAGLVRLGMDDVISEWLALDVMLPAPGQGALAIQCRADDAATIAHLKPLHDAAAAAAVTAERHFLYALGGGCSAPIAAHATVDNGVVELVARVGAHDGSKLIEVRGRAADPVALAQRLADDALAAGAQALLADVPA
ncbi:MAG: hydroxymethylbilane synthase, partial [Caldilineaceae bacterium]|nr:hydroxymethylbilane synthase [Caldilineaceae bacterium]